MTETIQKFLETAEGDAALTAKLEATQTPQDFLALAAQQGFALTEEDLASMTAPTGELSDDELDDVAGGMTMPRFLRDLFPRIGFLRFSPGTLLFRNDGSHPPQAQQTVFRSGEMPALDDLVQRGSPVQATTLPFSSEDEVKFVKL